MYARTRTSREGTSQKLSVATRRPNWERRRRVGRSRTVLSRSSTFPRCAGSHPRRHLPSRNRRELPAAPPNYAEHGIRLRLTIRVLPAGATTGSIIDILRFKHGGGWLRRALLV